MTVTVPLPYAPAFVGLRFFVQGAALDAGANLLGVTLSNGIDATIGQQ